MTAADVVLEELAYIYMPSRDPAADAAWFTGVLGGRQVFAIDGMGTRVAMIELTSSPPRVLFASHLGGDRPILVFRVADLAATLRTLKGRGWKGGRALELPMGPASSFEGPGGQRIALYEASRPFVVESFEGRRDF